MLWCTWPPGSGAQVRPGRSKPSISTVSCPRTGAGRRGGRRGMAVPRFAVGAPQPAERLGVDVLGPGQPIRTVAAPMSLAGEQAAAGVLLVQPQAEVHPALGGRLDHGEGAAGSDQADQSCGPAPWPGRPRAALPARRPGPAEAAAGRRTGWRSARPPPRSGSPDNQTVPRPAAPGRSPSRPDCPATPAAPAHHPARPRPRAGSRRSRPGRCV